ncbi:hypothetical protein ACEQ8H_002881 [Pleosporales sp. CAS-2024a]
MSRRLQNRTDESTATNLSITESLKDLVLPSWDPAGMYYFGDEEMRAAGPEVILRCMLSTKAAISTKSSLAEANQRAIENASTKHFSLIGKGQCGTIYGLKGTTMVMKLPNAYNKIDELFQDCQMHKLIYHIFSQVYSTPRSNLNVPKHEMWVSPDSKHFWKANGPLFGENVKVPNHGLVSERIFPLPQPVREAIVDALCPKEIVAIRDEFLNQAENKDCLVRLYLGRRHDNRTSKPQNIKMRNFPLHVNEMERIGLETKNFALVMAKALAILHWKAGVDANDVEFVLGGSPVISGNPTLQELLASDSEAAGKLYFSDFDHRTLSVWLLDFNECRQFKQDESGLAQLIKAFWFNDPYYPRPMATNARDKELWNAFSSHYLEVSAGLVGNHSGPKSFIDGIEEEDKKRSGNSLFG